MPRLSKCPRQTIVPKLLPNQRLPSADAARKVDKVKMIYLLIGFVTILRIRNVEANLLQDGEYDLVNTSLTITSAREYLGKFGWMQPADWTELSPRLNETIAEGGILESRNDVFKSTSLGNIEDHENDNQMTVLLNKDFKVLPDEEFVKALKSFQEAKGLVVTGILDDDTIAVMTQLRCGVPDQTKEPNATDMASAGIRTDGTSNTNATDQIEDISNFSGDNGALSSNNPSVSRKRRDVPDVNPLDVVRLNTWNKAEATLRDKEKEMISEAEPPIKSRLESMEEMLEVLRKEKLGDKNGSLNIQDHQKITHRPNSLLWRLALFSSDSEVKQRRKRSQIFNRFNPGNGWGLVFAKDTITWRLVKEWPSVSNFMSANEAWYTVKLALRMWSEVLPRNFLEDNVSPVSDVDVLIGFGTRRHNRCPVVFYQGRFVQEYAHAWPLPKAEVHFNDRQPFVPVSWIPTTDNGGSSSRRASSFPISLLKVALHEIGHTLGLPHSEDRSSIMNAIYLPFQSKDVVELQHSDRNSIKSIYGTCELQFDAVFDWVRKVYLPNGATHWKYNTYFFRKGWYWLYENRTQRPRYGDPKIIVDYWRGVMSHPIDLHQKIDGIVHIRGRSSPRGPTFFFKGDSYVEYDNDKDRAKQFDEYGRRYPRRIAEDFPGIPYPIDTVFYKWQEGLLYFFKGAMVYRYNWTRGELHDIKRISLAFPGWGEAPSLPNNIDAAYYSYTYQAYFFYKDIYFWKLADSRDRNSNRNIHIPYNAVGARRRISSQWKDICDVGESELLMYLPTS
ncbi:unnamed protein product [Clavelina lepadiformis]|uniref:Peptidase metallopeptidase domain-containing protein n=1 Tax=Clavelina lepadiformis TaxID=159417 RepID=A0ABP0G180_CLALP